MTSSPSPSSEQAHSPQAAAAAAAALAEARLRLLQLVSPALPVGGFSYSEGLEVLVQRGCLGDAAAVGRWLEAELRHGALALEAASLAGLQQDLAQARRAQPGDGAAMAVVRQRQGWLLAQREAAEVRAQQRQMGGSLCQLLDDLGWPLPDRAAAAGSLAWTAAWAWAGVCLELPPLALVEAYLYGWTANQISAAVRLVPLGPTEAQRLQLRLVPLLAERARVLVVAEPSSIWSGGVGAGLAQLGHGELYSRLFRS
jgi:urease accessory protein